MHGIEYRDSAVQASGRGRMPRLNMKYPYGRRTDPCLVKDSGILQPVMRFVKHIIFALKDLSAMLRDVGMPYALEMFFGP
jgi:hypothetical protein